MEKVSFGLAVRRRIRRGGKGSWEKVSSPPPPSCPPPNPGGTGATPLTAWLVRAATAASHNMYSLPSVSDGPSPSGAPSRAWLLRKVSFLTHSSPATTIQAESTPSSHGDFLAQKLEHVRALISRLPSERERVAPSLCEGYAARLLSTLPLCSDGSGANDALLDDSERHALRARLALLTRLANARARVAAAREAAGSESAAAAVFASLLPTAGAETDAMRGGLPSVGRQRSGGVSSHGADAGHAILEQCRRLLENCASVLGEAEEQLEGVDQATELDRLTVLLRASRASRARAREAGLADDEVVTATDTLPLGEQERSADNTETATLQPSATAGQCVAEQALAGSRAAWTLAETLGLT